MEAQKQITVHSEHTEGAPVIYLPVVMGNGGEVYNRCLELNCPPFTLVAIGGLDWNRELSPGDATEPCAMPSLSAAKLPVFLMSC